MKKTFNIYFLLQPIVFGLAIAWIDSQRNWDDTGITAFMILFVTTLFGFLSAQKPWLIALAVSIWIPIWGIACTSNYASLIALLLGFIGACLGYFAKKLITKR